MAVSPVPVNHAVLFVADLDRAACFYTEVFGMALVTREPALNGAFLRLPRSGNHHDLGLFGIPGAVPNHAGRWACTTWPGSSTPSTSSSSFAGPARCRRLHRRVEPRRHQKRRRRRPRRQPVRGHVDAPAGGVGPVRKFRSGRTHRSRSRIRHLVGHSHGRRHPPLHSPGSAARPTTKRGEQINDQSNSEP